VAVHDRPSQDRPVRYITLGIAILFLGGIVAIARFVLPLVPALLANLSEMPKRWVDGARRAAEERREPPSPASGPDPSAGLAPGF
jgi:hypothetical protein